MFQVGLLYKAVIIMALLDSLRERLQAQPTPTPAGSGVETVRKLIQAGTGKQAAPTTAPRQSNLQELREEAATRAGQRQLNLAGQIQSEQLAQREADITQRAQQADVQFQESFKDIQNNLVQKTNQLLNQFESGQKTLDIQKNISEIEQLGFNLRLQNAQYLNQLQTAGQVARLDNELEFKKQLAQNVFRDNQQLLINDLAFQRIIEADDREFAAELAAMNTDYALEVAANALKSQNIQTTAAGAGSIVSGAISPIELKDGTKITAAQGIFNTLSSAGPGASGAPLPNIPNRGEV